MFILVICGAGKNLFAEQLAGTELALFAPVMLALLNFFVIKSVFSQDDNHGLIFMMVGMYAALSYRCKGSITLTGSKPRR